jgi:hypothetical protein
VAHVCGHGKQAGPSSAYPCAVAPLLPCRGLQLINGVPTTPNGAFILALNRFSGDLVWKTRVDDHPAAQVTQVREGGGREAADASAASN